MKMIAAVDRKWGIGYQNKLLVSIPEDMKNFRMITTGGIVVMGRKTLESFPGGIPLAERTNIILSKDKNYKLKNGIVVHSLEEALERLQDYDTEDIYIIGGESIYRQFLPYVDEALITYIDYPYQADAYFPNLEQDEAWEMIEESEEHTYFNLEYYFRRYRKKQVNHASCISFST